MSDGRDRSRADAPPASPQRPPPREPDAGDRNATTWKLFARDLLSSVLAVLVVGAYLFAVSGVWPPLVAIESPSMVPNMEENDLVFVMEETRFPGEGAIDGTGVVTASEGQAADYTRFGQPGDVIVYERNGNANATPIIHRAMLYVEEGERWYDRANPEYVGGASNCAELANCPADYSGFITKGDNNRNYDQVGPQIISDPVRAEWVVGTAEVRVPGVGWLRLRT